jgi:hypothetical protein
MGIANSFVMNKLWSFESSKPSIGTLNQICRFVGINILSLGVTLYGLHYLNDILNFNIYVSKVFVTLIAQVINYLGYKLLVFAGKQAWRTGSGVPGCVVMRRRGRFSGVALAAQSRLTPADKNATSENRPRRRIITQL